MLAKSATPPISLVAINHTRIRVSDPARSLAWYQSLFGLPIVARQGDTVILRIGEGPQFLEIAGKPSDKPGIVHMGLAIDGFDADRVLQRLQAHKTLASTARIETRRPELGGDPSGTPELFLEDPDGISIQLQDRSYCGGGGTLGNLCLAEPEAPKAGGLSLIDYNHLTTFVRDRVQTLAFYRTLFPMPIDIWQGALPLLRVGAGNQFLAFLGVGSRRSFQPFIHHVCFTVKDFDPDGILDALADFGIKTRKSTKGPVKPLQSYVSMRMPNRGGAPQGTPELYFTDPDGIRLQVQDVRYNGGGGYLGNEGASSKSPDRNDK
jgi:catechol 2,3-dioxygenase-like lactoylglutathione lyase family enzyme